MRRVFRRRLAWRDVLWIDGAPAIASGRARIWRELVALRVAGGGRLDRDTLAAAAGVGLVRIVEHELGRQLGRLEVDLRAEQEQDRLGLDQDADALVLDDLVER